MTTVFGPSLPLIPTAGAVANLGLLSFTSCSKTMTSLVADSWADPGLALSTARITILYWGVVSWSRIRLVVMAHVTEFTSKAISSGGVWLRMPYVTRPFSPLSMSVAEQWPIKEPDVTFSSILMTEGWSLNTGGLSFSSITLMLSKDTVDFGGFPRSSAVIFNVYFCVLS